MDEPESVWSEDNREVVMAVYEFISLKCVSQNEFGGDEIFVQYADIQVFPAAGFQAAFRTGDTVVNLQCSLEGEERAKYIEVSGAHPVEPYEGYEGFLRKDIPDQGLVIQVWEDDLINDDLMGKIIVFPTRSGGPVTKQLDQARTGKYEITYQVF